MLLLSGHPERCKAVAVVHLVRFDAEIKQCFYLSYVTSFSGRNHRRIPCPFSELAPCLLQFFHDLRLSV